MFKKAFLESDLEKTLSPRLSQIYDKVREVEFKINILNMNIKKKIVPVFTLHEVLDLVNSLVGDSLAIIETRIEDKEIHKKAEKKLSELLRLINKAQNELALKATTGDPGVIATKVLMLLPVIKSHLDVFIKPAFNLTAEKFVKNELYVKEEEVFAQELVKRLGVVYEEEEVPGKKGVPEE